MVRRRPSLRGGPVRKQVRNLRHSTGRGTTPVRSRSAPISSPLIRTLKGLTGSPQRSAFSLLLSVEVGPIICGSDHPAGGRPRQPTRSIQLLVEHILPATVARLAHLNLRRAETHAGCKQAPAENLKSWTCSQATTATPASSASLVSSSSPSGLGDRGSDTGVKSDLSSVDSLRLSQGCVAKYMQESRRIVSDKLPNEGFPQAAARPLQPFVPHGLLSQRWTARRKKSPNETPCCWSRRCFETSSDGVPHVSLQNILKQKAASSFT